MTIRKQVKNTYVDILIVILFCFFFIKGSILWFKLQNSTLLLHHLMWTHWVSLFAMQYTDISEWKKKNIWHWCRLIFFFFFIKINCGWRRESVWVWFCYWKLWFCWKLELLDMLIFQIILNIAWDIDLYKGNCLMIVRNCNGKNKPY